MPAERVELDRGLLRVGDRRVPLFGGEVHFFRTDPDHWDVILERMAEADFAIVSTYLSWRRHEPVPGAFDFTGGADRRLDVRGFLDRCRAHGLLVHIKPGPWICAEEEGGGLPDWLLEDRELWALDAADEPILGYNPPWQHHVPSYLHPRYLRYVRRWLRAVDRSLTGYFFPDGPIVLCQLDNEPSYAFRDSMFGFDYNATTLAAFRSWLRRRYRTLDRIERAWDRPVDRWAAVDAPRSPEGTTPSRRELDWIEFREWLIAEYVRRLRAYHMSAGVDRVVFTTNHNEHAVDAVPQDGRRIGLASRGTGGPDLYFVPPLDGTDLSRLARMIAVGRALDPAMAWAPELQAGIWRTPGEAVADPSPQALEFWWRAAIAFGLRGLNLYMLAERERWGLAPLDANGTPGLLWSAVERLRELVGAVVEDGPLDPVLPLALYRQERLGRYEYGRDAGRQWAPTFAELFAAGALPSVWEGRSDEPPGSRAVIVIRPDLLLRHDAHQLGRFASTGGLVIVISDGDKPGWTARPSGSVPIRFAVYARSVAEAIASLDEANIRPPTVVDDPGIRAVLARGGTHDVLFLIRAGSEPGPVAVHLRGGGYRRLMRLGGSFGEARLDGELVSAHVPGMSVAVYRLERAAAIIDAGPAGRGPDRGLEHPTAVPGRRHVTCPPTTAPLTSHPAPRRLPSAPAGLD